MKSRKSRAALMTLLAFVLAAVFVGAACKHDPEPPTDTRTVTISRKALELDRFGSATLTAEATDGATVEWLSANAKIATVDGGTVTATGVGSTTVTVRIVGTDIADTCAVTVTAATETPLLSLDKARVDVVKGGTLSVTPSVTYRGAAVTDVAYSYKTDDTTVATVSNGVVTGVKVGTTKLAVEAVWKGETLTKSIDVAVKADAAVEIKSDGAIVSAVTLRTSLPAGVDETYIDRIALTATAYEKGQAVERAVTWSVVEGDAVEVTDGTVTAVRAGTATVRAKFTTAENDEVYADVPFTVVLPDLNSDATVVIDRTDPELTADFSDVTDEEIVGIRHAGTDVLDGDALNAAWVALQPDGELTVQVLTQDVVYNVTVKLFTRFAQADLTDVNICESGNGGAPLGGLWSEAAADEVVGDRSGVYKYERTDQTGDAFSNRVELNDYMAHYGAHNGYLVFDVYSVSGPGVAAWTKGTADVWIDLDVGAKLAADRGFYIDGQGVKTDTLRRGEWMKVVLKVGDKQANRFALMTKSGQPAKYYVADMRFYAKANWDTPYHAGASEIALTAGASKTLTAADLDIFFGETAITDLTKAVFSGGDTAVATVSGQTVTAVASGRTVWTLTVSQGRESLAIPVSVVVATAVAPVPIDRGGGSVC